MVFGVLLFASVQGRTVEGPGQAHLRSVGEAFQRVTGRAVAAELEDAVVYASDPSLLETRLPRVLEASWCPTGRGGRKLERTPEQSRIVRAQGEAFLRSTLAKGLETSSDLRRAPYDVSLASRLINGLGTAVVVGDQYYGPSGAADVLFQHLLAELAPRLEREVTFRKRTVYALVPTEAEASFGPSAAARVAAYPAIEREIARRYAEGKSVRLESWDLDRVVPRGVRPGEEDPGVGRVAIEFDANDRDLAATMNVYRPDGSSRVRVGWNFPSVRPPVRPFHFPREADPFQRPEENPSLAAPGSEPLDVTVAPALDALARRLGIPVVTAVPDAVAIALAETPPTGLGSVVRALETAGVEFAIEDGVLVGRPVDLVRFERQNLTRSALRRWTKAMREPGNDWLRAWSRLYAESRWITPLAAYLRTTVLPSEGLSAPNNGYLRWTYRLLGRLSDAEWETLTAGRPVPVGNDAARREMAAAISIRLDRTEAGARPPDAALGGTFSFPHGIPASATLTMTAGEQIVYRTAQIREWTDVVVLTDNAYAVPNPPSEATVETFERDLERRGGGDGTIEFGRRGVRILALRPDPASGLMKRQEQDEIAVRSEGPAGPFRNASQATRELVLAGLRENLELRRKEAGRPPP